MDPPRFLKPQGPVHCPLCGTERLHLRAKLDPIDRLYQTPSRKLQQFFGAQLYHCWVCRIQFYDLGAIAAPAGEMEAETQPAAQPPPVVLVEPDRGGQTLIGETVTIRGRVSSAENIFVQGAIEGPIAIPAHRLTIGRTGRVRGDVRAGEVAASGAVRGNLDARSRVALGASANVIGDIRAASLSIAEGAYLQGKVETLDS